MSDYSVLFEPVRIGPVTAPNRFYAVPHATGHGWAQPKGANALRAMKAEGGWVTVAMQICEIGPDTDMANRPMERIWDDTDKPGGLTHDGEGRDVVETLAELPDLWDVNLAGWPADSQSARFSEEGFQLPFTDFVKSVTSKPVVGVGRFTSPDLMVSLVRKGQLDLIGAARPSIADPFLPTKIREGRIEEIRECIGCNICVSMDSVSVRSDRSAEVC